MCLPGKAAAPVGHPPSIGADLAGRTAELELMGSLPAGRARGGTSLLLRGAPGVGKTALLDAAAARAADVGMRVLRASGVEFEAEMNFSALHQMLRPLRRLADRLAGHHRDVLDRIFGLAPGPSPDPLAASTAVLALLGEVTVERPLLMIADDVPWMDGASATALGFVVRRISDDPVVFLAAARTGRELMLDTLDAWFGCGGSAEEAAKCLFVHPNTVRMRLRRIAERTGRSLADPRGITELSLALRAVRQTPKPPSSESTGTTGTPETADS